MSSQWKMTVSLMRNGKVISVSDLNTTKESQQFEHLAQSIDHVINTVSKTFFDMQKETIEREILDSILSTKNRPRTDPAKQLHEMYKEAMQASKYTQGSQSNKIEFLDESVLDKLCMAYDRTEWWRIYEYGSPTSRSGGSEHYRFIPLEGWGKHGEGIMQKTDKPEKAHPGVRPIHVLSSIREHMNSVLRDGAFGKAVMNLLEHKLGQ